MAQQSQSITFTASADLAKRIDEAAATEGCSRSAVIREAVEEYVSEPCAAKQRRKLWANR